jgi:hypothetical protein
MVLYCIVHLWRVLSSHSGSAFACSQCEHVVRVRGITVKRIAEEALARKMPYSEVAADWFPLLVWLSLHVEDAQLERSI